MISRKKIEEYANAVPRFKSLPYEHRMKAVNYIPIYCKQLGINCEQTKPELEAMTKFLLDHFGYMNAKEMIMALELYGSGEIVIQKEKQHFGKLTLTFLGAVFKQYELLKQQVRTEQPIPNEYPQLPEADIKTKRKKEYIETLKWIQEDKKLPVQANYIDCYHHLKEVGELNLSKEDYNEILSIVENSIQLETQMMLSVKKRKDHFKLYEKTGEAFKNRCREMVVKMWLQDKLTSNTDAGGSFDKWILEQINK